MPLPSARPPTPGHAPAVPGAREQRPRRGQVLSGVVLALAVVVAVILGTCAYLGLATVRLSSVDPLGAALTWLTIDAYVLAAVLVVVALAVGVLVVSRPKYLACLASVVAVVLPFGAAYLGVSLGIPVAARNAAVDGAVLADLLDALDRACARRARLGARPGGRLQLTGSRRHRVSP